MKQVYLDENYHRYTVDGAERPGVSAIVKNAGFENPFIGRNPIATRFGTALHAVIKYDLLDIDCDMDDDPGLQNAFAAYLQWKEDYKPIPIHTKEPANEGGGYYIERPLYSERYRYCGTPDLCCLIKNREAVIDWKSGVYDKIVTPLKMCAYEDLFRENENILHTRRILKYVVMLSCNPPVKNKKRYRVIPITDESASITWRSCLNIVRWKEHN